jgi:hypothetical protein
MSGKIHAALARRVTRLVSSTAGALALALSASNASAAGPQVALLIEPPPSPIKPGDTLVYRIHLSNLNKTTATGALEVEANIPQHMYATGQYYATCSPSSCYGGAQARYGSTMTWKKTLAAGESTSWNVALHVDNSVAHAPPADGTDVALDVVVKSGATKSAGSSVSVATDYTPAAFDLAVSGPTRTAPGAEVEYTLRYGNQSAAAAAGVLSLPLPSGARVVTASSGAVQKGNAIEWDLGSVPAGSSDVRAVRLRLDAKAAAGSLFMLQPELRAAGRTEPSRAPLGVTVLPPSPVAVTVKAAPDPAAPGGTVVYKLELTNQSPDAPTGKFAVSATIPNDGYITRTNDAKCYPSSCYGGAKARHGSDISWDVPSLAPGATAPLQFAFVVDKPADAAPPPNGSLLQSHITTSLGSEIRVNLALGNAKTVGKGKPMVPLGTPEAAPKPAPVAAPTPAPAPIPVSAPAPEPVAEAEPEPAVEEIPEAEIVAELPPADDEAKLPAEEVKQRGRWKSGDWDKYCEKRWQSRGWDRHCAKRWWKKKDWSQYCKTDGRKHGGWKKFCARDFRSWRFAHAKKKHHGGKQREERHQGRRSNQR